MEAIVLHLRLIKGVRGDPLTYVVRQNVKVVHISPGYSTYLKLDEKMMTRTPIVHVKSNLK